MTRQGFVEESQGSAELLQWSVSSSGKHVTIALKGEVDLGNVAALGNAIDHLVEAHAATVTVDLADLSFLDSSGLRCLCNAAERAAAAGCELRVCRPTSTVLRVLEICGVDELLLGRSNGDESEGS